MRESQVPSPKSQVSSGVRSLKTSPKSQVSSLKSSDFRLPLSDCRFASRLQNPEFRFSFRTWDFLKIVFVLLAFVVSEQAQARRVVIIKADGVGQDLVDELVRTRDPKTGMSALPWIKRVFYDGGARLENFYTRGITLSAPSWALLDTGQHAQIKGNVEFDRYTMQSYHYLDTFEFFVNAARSRRTDMYGVEVLDDLGVPLLSDAYKFENRYISPQIYQRGARLEIFPNGFENRFTSRTPRELLDEFTIGWSGRDIVSAQTERDIIKLINESNVDYLDYFTSDIDHVAHLNRDRFSQMNELKRLDALVGRIWTAIERSPRADETALILISDHGMNTSERLYSQGYNLVWLLGSAAGGGHHTITKRWSWNEFTVKGIAPEMSFAKDAVNVAADSYYLKNDSRDYPTALLDYDGNERASLHLRDSDLNLLHILLQQLKRRDLAPAVRRAAAETFFATIDRRRAQWQETIEDLREEIGALNRLIESERALYDSLPKEWSPADINAGRDEEAKRLRARIELWAQDARDYANYARIISNLLALKRETFDPAALKIEDVIPPRAMGDQNSIYQLQNYIVGLAPQGLVLSSDGKTLDIERSFKRIDYFALLTNITVRNNVQRGMSDHPVDFVAARLPQNALPFVSDEHLDCAIWINGGSDSQALILAREDRRRGLQLRYLPIANLRQSADGKIEFARASLRAGLPLHIFEDPNLILPDGVTDRAAWLSEWHSDLEWLCALHRTKYSNGLIGLHEQLARHALLQLSPDAPGLSADQRLINRLRLRERALTETDLLLLANDHWNFNLSGFNPGGNHGSFFRISTHSVLMFAGGGRTGIPRGAIVSEPYDSLSFVPTVLSLAGKLNEKAINLLPARANLFPGRIINELSREKRAAPNANTAGNGQ
jgi:hypothetical protein